MIPLAGVPVCPPTHRIEGKNVDARQFDTVVKAWGNGTNRRRVLQGLLVAGAGLGLGRGAALETNAAGATKTATLYLTAGVPAWNVGCYGDLTTPPETRGQVNYSLTKTGRV